MSPPRDQESNGSPLTDTNAPSLRQLRSILGTTGAARHARADAADAGTRPIPPAPPRRPRSRSGSFDADTSDRVLTADELLDLVTVPTADTTPAARLSDPPRQSDQESATGRALVRFEPPVAKRLRTSAQPGDPIVVRPTRLRDRRVRYRTGVAPFTRPSMRRNKRQRRRDYRKLGFIELTPEKARLRHRILPRTVLGVSAMLLSMGVGAAFAGASLYAYYDNRLTENETRIDDFASGFETNFGAAITEVQRSRDSALESIDLSATLLQDWVDASNAVVELPQKVGGSVYVLRTLDIDGRPILGSAFVVSSEADSSLLLTTYELVAAATAEPGPKVTIQQGRGEALTAEVWAWDASLDLALLKVERGGLPTLVWASDQERATVTGGRVYLISGLGASGATAAQSMVVDQNADGMRLDTPLEADFRGGPIVNAGGEILAVGTGAYNPFGFTTRSRPYAPFITSACKDSNRGVLICPDALTATATEGVAEEPDKVPFATQDAADAGVEGADGSDTVEGARTDAPEGDG